MKKYFLIIYIIYILLIPTTLNIYGLSHTKILMLLTIIGFIIEIVVKYKKNSNFNIWFYLKEYKLNKTIICIAIFTLIVWISTIINNGIIMSNISEMLRGILYIFIILYLILALDTKEKRNMILRLVLICVFINCIIGITQWFNIFNINELYVKYVAPTQYPTLVNNYPAPRIVGLTSNPNTFGFIIVMGIIVNIKLITENRKKLFYYLSIFVLFISEFMTMSRTSFIALVVAFAIYVIIALTKKYKMGKVILLSFIILSIFVVIIFLLPNDLTNRLKELFDLENSRSWQLRLDRFEELSDIISNNALIGIGPDVLKNEVKMFYDNEWLLIIVKYGILGIISFITIFIANAFYKIKNIYANIMYISLTIAGFVFMVANTFYHNYEIFNIFLIILVLETNKIEKNKVNNKNTIIFSTVLPIWSMKNGSGGKALYSTIDKYIKEEWNVILITDEENDYNKIAIKKENIYYINSKILKRFTQIPKLGMLVRLIYSKYIKFKFYNTLVNIVQSNEFSNVVLYAYEVHSVLASKKISKITNIPLITRFQGTAMYVVEDNIKNRIKRYPHMQALDTKADLIIMTDDGSRGEEVLKNHNNNSDILFIRNGVNILDNVETLESNDQIDYKKEMGLPDDKIILLTVSRLESWKRVDRAINALYNMKEKDKYILIIVGDGAKRKELEELVKKKNLNNVVFTGSIENGKVYKYMKIADIFLSLYDLSNVGNPLLEALCMGKAIITLDVGDTNKVINTNNGILLKDDNIEGICEAIKQLSNKEIKKEYEKNAKEYASKNLYSWKNRMDIELLKVIEVIEKKKVN